MFECFHDNNLLRFMCVANGRVNLWGRSLYLSLCVCLSLFACVSLSLCLSVCVSVCPPVPLCVSAINFCVYKYNAFVLRILLVPVLVLFIKIQKTTIFSILFTKIYSYPPSKLLTFQLAQNLNKRSLYVVGVCQADWMCKSVQHLKLAEQCTG